MRPCSRTFRCGGSKELVPIRAEFYNLFNTPNFSPPGGTFGTSTFGVVSAQQNTPRQIQFGLRILF